MWLHLPVVVICVCLSQTVVANVRPVRQAANAVGSRCTTPDNKAGTCVNIKSCQSLNNSQNTQFVRQSQCGSASAGSQNAVYCCPNTVSTTSTTVTSTTVTSTRSTTVTSTRSTTASSRATPKPVDTNYEECGKSTKKDSRIVGGVNATLGDWPWMVALGYRTSSLSTNPDFKCGASLISKNWVITAAHCVLNTGNLKLFMVRLGDLDLNPDVKDGATPIDAEIAEVIPHPQYTTSPTTNDVALIRLKDAVKFSQYVRPICLLNGSEYRSETFYNRKRPYIIGWGALEWRGAMSTRLQETTINTVNITSCAKSYAEQQDAKIDERVLCAGEKGRDTCQGDSGGPLIFPVQADGTNVVYYLGGIVSFGIKCADLTFPGVYTRVAAFNDWISQTTGLGVK